MSVPEIVRPSAQFVFASDGDTYYMLCNFMRDRKPPWHGSQMIHIRLRDYGAREHSDKAAVDPKGLGRVDGPTAKKIASDVLASAKHILVEFQGLDDRGREICWIWIDGLSLGEQLAAEHVVGRTDTMGTVE